MDRGRGLAVAEVERAAQLVGVGVGVADLLEVGAARQRRGEQFLEALGAGFARDPVDVRRALGRREIEGEGERARFGDQRRRLAVIGDREARRDIGLEWEEMQQAFAECVDGLDLQAAGGLDRAREQAAGECEPGRVGLRRAELDDRFGERRVVERGPRGERLEHPRRHVRGGGLGEGEAEQARGRRAGEQQPQHALGQHMRLTRARVGRHPGGGLGIGGLRLEPLDAAEDVGALVAHASSPSPPSAWPAVADHSLTRARWS